MKKKFTIGLIALLSVSLFVLGCSTDDEEEEAAAETFTAVTEYTAGTNNPTGLTVSAVKSDQTGIIYIDLSGTIGNAFIYNTVNEGTEAGGSWQSGDWGPWDSTPEEGKYAAVYIDGVFTEEMVTEVLAIRQDNAALRFYTDAGDIHITGTPVPSIQHSSSGKSCIWLTDSLTIKWKLNDASSISDTEPFSVLLWSGAPSKTATFNIRSYDDYAENANPTNDVNLTIVIRYGNEIFE
jgi:hypothetical protein